MCKILKKDRIAEDVFSMVVESRRIAAKRRAGQFVILRATETGERIPLTIVDSSPEHGTITIVFQAVGKSTKAFAEMAEQDAFADIVGPLGNPTHIEKFGRAVCVGGGIGIAPMLPIAHALRDAGNQVIGIIGARTKELLILEDEMRETCDALHIMTDDGSYCRQGFVTEALQEELDTGAANMCFAIGPVPMMRAICRLTKEYDVSTLVSLNSIMIDGTGMCGGCRVTVGGKTCFTCVDGPEFDGHKVDFDELTKRLTTYRDLESEAHHECKLNDKAVEIEE